MLRKHMSVNKGWCEKPSILYTIPPSRWIQLKSSVNTKSQKSTLNPKMLQYFSFPEKLFLTNQFSFKTFRMNLSLLFWCMHVYEHVYKWKCVCVCVCAGVRLLLYSSDQWWEKNQVVNVWKPKKVFPFAKWLMMKFTDNIFTEEL